MLKDYNNKSYEVFYVPERKNKFVRIYKKETMIMYKIKGYENVKESINLFSIWFFDNHIETNDDIENYFLRKSLIWGNDVRYATDYYLIRYFNRFLTNRKTSIEDYIVDNFFSNNQNILHLLAVYARCLGNTCKPLTNFVTNDMPKSPIVRFENNDMDSRRIKLVNNEIIVSILESIHERILKKYDRYCYFCVQNSKHHYVKHLLVYEDTTKKYK